MTTPPKALSPSVNGWNAEYLDEQFTKYQHDPESVPADLRMFFQGFDLAEARAPSAGSSAPALKGKAREIEDHLQAGVSSLIYQYRSMGHLCASIDPFGREREMPGSLMPDRHGLTEQNLDTTYDSNGLSASAQSLPLSEIIEILDQTYCNSVGVEFMHVIDDEEREWLAQQMEHSRNRQTNDNGRRAHILYQLHRAELFEKFCGKRYPGVKRFSLEGGESLIPMLDQLVERAADEYGVKELVFTMSHRGRLNVLTNIIGKTYEQIFTEFNDSWREDEEVQGGDVKYHRGFSASRLLPSGKQIWLAMASNPSHLEAACGVALGRTRAKQRLHGDTERTHALPVLLHGDGAVIGQGVVAEAFNLSQLKGYTVGGAMHIVVNNLIGFTTGEEDARSTRYCTDMAKMIAAPIFHVNGEDPEACVHVMGLALDYRMRYKKDVIIDLVCYRRHGHNETDEAMFTQPLLYKEIKNKPSVLKTYAERLLVEGVITNTDVQEINKSLDENLDRAFRAVKETPVDPTPDPGANKWIGVDNTFNFDHVNTAVHEQDLLEISRAMGTWPENFKPHPKLAKLLKVRAACVSEDKPLDWGTAETLAIGSILIEGTITRFSGQDSRRGTFSHRHAVIRDYDTAETYCPLNFIREMGVAGTDKDSGTVSDDGVIRQAKYCIYDSPLSEYAVLGFEYGFSLASPNMLVIWEAQFGDFSNGAQVIFDQFIASAEAKWHRWSGLVCLLPHGYEGQGPEHSSARLERFLKLCGKENMQVCNPTTPAQLFHMLRRQVLRKFRKPLIVMSPKSLLRHPKCVSSVSDLTTGSFKEIMDDPRVTSKKAKAKISRVLLCSGKVYYDLDVRRQETGREDVAIVRVEQVYPFHTELYLDILSGYPDDVEVHWVQEEPQNMGAWGHLHLMFYVELGRDLPYIGRQSSPTPATGSPTIHRKQLDAFLSEAVGALEPQAANA